jgi:hypothetical protein
MGIGYIAMNLDDKIKNEMKKVISDSVIKHLNFLIADIPSETKNLLASAISHEVCNCITITSISRVQMIRNFLGSFWGRG